VNADSFDRISSGPKHGAHQEIRRSGSPTPRCDEGARYEIPPYGQTNGIDLI
jgi:hypothetical protein